MRGAIALLAAIATASALAAGAAVAPGAAAHEELPGVRSVLDGVEPELPGVVVQVVRSAADQLVVSNPTQTVLAVLDDRGRPFLRIGAGTVEADVASRAWYASLNPFEGAGPPEATDGEARWVRVAAEPSWGWFDHRLHQRRLTAPPATRRGGPVRLEAWQVPMRYGDLAVVVRGHREYRRPLGSFVPKVTAQAPGLRATVLPGTVPAIHAEWTGLGEVTVRGEDGEPLARLSNDGAHVNLGSRTWALTGPSRGLYPVPAVSAGAASWHRLGGSRLTWLDPRLRPPARLEDAAERGERLSADAKSRWSIPVEVDGRTAQLRGVTSWVPVDASAGERSQSPVWVLMLVGAVTAATITLLSRLWRSTARRREGPVSLGVPRGAARSRGRRGGPRRG